ALPRSAGPAGVTLAGAARTAYPPAGGTSYDVHAVQLDPSPASLRRVPASLPPGVRDGDLGTVEGERVPLWGTPGRDAVVRRILLAATAVAPRWRGWNAAYARAVAVTAHARTPYGAVLALESWLRTRRYDANVSLAGVRDMAPLAAW